MQDKVMKCTAIDNLYFELDKLYTELNRLPEDEKERELDLELQITTLEAELSQLIRES